MRAVLMALCQAPLSQSDTHSDKNHSGQIIKAGGVIRLFFCIRQLAICSSEITNNQVDHKHIIVNTTAYSQLPA